MASAKEFSGKGAGRGFLGNILPYEQIAEALTNIVEGQAIRNVAVSGIDSGVGVSTICSDLAQTLSLSNHTILLIRVLPAPAGKEGGADVIARLQKILKGQEKNIQAGVTHINLMTDELPRPASPQEGELVKIMQGLEQVFSVILWDLPPSDQAVQSRMISQYTQGVVLVVEAGRTRWQTARHVIDHFRFSGCNILGIILNKKKNYIPSWLYKLLFRDI